MTEYIVWKTGFQTFDSLHALGIATSLAQAQECPVRVRDAGVAFSVEPAQKRYQGSGSACKLRDILALPRSANLADANKLELDNLDGLLAATSTIPGLRLISLADTMAKAALEPTVMEYAIAKAAAHVKRIEGSVVRAYGEHEWLSCCLEEYAADRAQPPVLQNGKIAGRMTLTLTLDPALGYATRQKNSNGMVGIKVNTCMRSPVAGGAFAFVGAARYLRAQRTGGSIVLLFAPLVADMMVHSHDASDRLPSTGLPARYAMYKAWLASWRRKNGEFATGLSVQSLQTQVVKQSISVNRASLSFAPLNYLAARGCKRTLGQWEKSLQEVRSPLGIDNDCLLDMLSHFDTTLVVEHLADNATVFLRGVKSTGMEYRLEEIRAMVDLDSQAGSPLSQILSRENGTLRFGRALRNLAELKRSDVREIIDDLDAVRDRNQLLRILTRAVQLCVIAKAKTDFIRIPTEEDLKLLLDDVEQFGAGSVARLLMILATVHFSRHTEDPSQVQTSNIVPPDDEGTPEGVDNVSD